MAQPAPRTPAAAQVSVPAPLPSTGPAPAPLARAAAQPADPYAIRVLLAPALETTLVSPTAARVAGVHVGLGDAFPRGRVLVSFDCAEQQARLKMAEAELSSAREQHDAKLRLQGLQQAGEVEVSLAAAAAAKARAQLDLYRAQARQCSVTAPFSGRAVRLTVKPHQGVAAAQPLLEIVSDGPLKLRLNAPAAWIRWLKVGTPFEVDIDETGRRYKATVSALNGRIDAVSQTIELEGTMAARAAELLPGMSGTARFAPPR